MSEQLAEGGGMFGVAASIIFRSTLGDLGSYMVLTALALIGFLLTFQISFMEILRMVGDFIAHIFRLLFSLGQKTPEKKQKKTVLQKNKKSEEQKTIITV